MPKNFKAPLIKSLGEAGYRTTDYGYSRMTFTYARKNGTRKVKLWLGTDVFDSTRKQQLDLERRLRSNYGDKYINGYFVVGARGGLGGSKSFVVIIRND